MARLTRCDVCECELPPGQRGYHIEALDTPLALINPLTAWWDVCGTQCLTELTIILTQREAQRGDI